MQYHVLKTALLGPDVSRLQSESIWSLLAAKLNSFHPKGPHRSAANTPPGQPGLGNGCGKRWLWKPLGHIAILSASHQAAGDESRPFGAKLLGNILLFNQHLNKKCSFPLDAWDDFIAAQRATQF